MRIDEAIKELEHQKSFISPERGQRWIDAMNLGIEALKRVIDGRGNLYPFSNVQLKGETELALRKVANALLSGK